MRPVVTAATLGLTTEDPSLVNSPDAPFAPGLSHPPTSWFFEKPDWFQDDTKIWVDSQGRAAGWYYHSGTCLIDGNEDGCWSPEPSPTGNEVFHQGELLTDDGDLVQVGVIGGGGDHAPSWMPAEQAGTYYAAVSTQLLVGRIYDDPNVGGYFLGAVLPHVSCARVDMVRRSALSGDWRYRKKDNAGRTLEAYDAVGPWLVTRPGLPLARQGAYIMRVASASDVMHPVYVGGGRGSNQYKSKGGGKERRTATKEAKKAKQDKKDTYNARRLLGIEKAGGKAFLPKRAKNVKSTKAALRKRRKIAKGVAIATGVILTGRAIKRVSYQISK